MKQYPVRHVPAAVLLIAVAAMFVAVHAQEQSAIYLLAVDQQGTPLLDVKASDIVIKEDVGPSTIVSIRRFGWPLKVTVLVDNGPCGFSRGQAVREVHLHAPNPAQVRLGVQPEAPGGAHRAQQAIPALPGPEHVVADAQSPAQLADAQEPRWRLLIHAHTVQHLDKPLTSACCRS